MKICDKCFQTKGESKPAPHTMGLGNFEEFDLCESCYNKVKDLMSEKEVKKRKPRKAPKKKQ